LDTHENISKSTGTCEITKQSLKISSSSAKQQRDKTLPFHIVQWLYKWFKTNMFAPGFLYPEDESDGYSRIRSNLLGNYEQFNFRSYRKII
jgi:hypothetical protein